MCVCKCKAKQPRFVQAAARNHTRLARSFCVLQPRDGFGARVRRHGRPLESAPLSRRQDGLARADDRRLAVDVLALDTRGRRCRLDAVVDGAAARVIIDDDGPGIAPEQRDAVFQPFVRLEDSRNRTTGGTGLGLAIVKKVMDRHGARMTLTDSPSGGLRVIVELDLA